MILFIIALWLIVRHIRRHRLTHRYRIDPTDTVYTVNIADYLPQTIPEAEPDPTPPDYFTEAEVERLDALRTEYMELLDAIEQEQRDLRTEYDTASAKRRSAISSKLTTLAGRHAATTRTLHGIDTKRERLYNAAHAFD